MAAPMTRDGLRILEAVGAFWRQQERGPTVRELSERLGITPSVAHVRVRDLIIAGHLTAEYSGGKMVAHTIRPTGVELDKVRALLKRFVYAYAGVDIARKDYRLNTARMELELWRIWHEAAPFYAVEPGGFGRAVSLSLKAREIERNLERPAPDPAPPAWVPPR